MERRRLIDEQDQTPFKSRLRQDGDMNRGAKFLELKGRPDKVIRQHELETYLEDEFPNLEPIERVAEGNKLLRELSGKYGLRVAANMVVGEGREGDTPKVYTVAERVNGAVLESVATGKNSPMSPEEKKHFLKEAEDLLSSLAHYYIDKFGSKEFFWWDLVKEGQYMYGSLKGETEKHIYLVDVDSIYVSNKKEDALADLKEFMSFVFLMRTGRPEITGRDAMDQISNFLKTIPPDLKSSTQDRIRRDVEAICKVINKV